MGMSAVRWTYFPLPDHELRHPSIDLIDRVSGIGQVSEINDEMGIAGVDDPEAIPVWRTTRKSGVKVFWLPLRVGIVGCYQVLEPGRDLGQPLRGGYYKVLHGATKSS